MLSVGGAITSIPYIALVAAAGLLYNTLIDNPLVRAEARAGLVSTVELAAERAKLAETQRQAQAALNAGNAFTELLRTQAAELAKQAEEVEKEQDAYAKRIKAEKRSCPISADDIRYLNRSNGVPR